MSARQMPLLWFVYPLNGSGRRNPDAADRGQDSFLFYFFYVRERSPAWGNLRAALSFRSPDPIRSVWAPARVLILSGNSLSAWATVVILQSRSLGKARQGGETALLRFVLCSWLWWLFQPVLFLQRL